MASATVEQMKMLWAVEDEVRGQPPELRLAARRAASVEIVQGTVRPVGARTAAHLRQIETRRGDPLRPLPSRAKLLLFLEDGRVEIDSNIVERAIRPQTITRKNSLFAGSAGGGRTWAAIATMLQTCKMNGVDPYAWATTDPGAHRQPMAQQRHRGTDALELQDPQLNGSGWTLTLKRQLSLPVSTMSQWCVRRSSNAVVIFGSPNTLGHSPKARLVVTRIDVRS